MILWTKDGLRNEYIGCSDRDNIERFILKNPEFVYPEYWTAQARAKLEEIVHVDSGLREVFGSPTKVGINSDLGYKASFVYNGPGWGLYDAYIEWCHSGNRSYYTQDGSGKFPKRYLWGYNFLGVMCHAYPNCLAPIFNSMIRILGVKKNDL